MSNAPPPFPSPTKRWHTTEQPITSPTRPELSAKGKSIIITGGGNTGIGGETARKFAEAGASRIALLGRREGPLLANKAWINARFPAVDIIVLPTDVTKKADVDAAFSRFAAGAAGGKIDILVHSAAVVGPREAVTVADGEMYLETVHANVAGSLWVAQAFVRVAVPDAVVIAINSFAAHLTIGNVFVAYGASKMAVYRLWDTVRIAHPDIRVFHTQPGVVVTELNTAARDLKKVKTDDVSLPASFNVWLASPEARFLQGKFVWCNWDVEELMARAKEIEGGTLFNMGLVGWPFTDAS